MKLQNSISIETEQAYYFFTHLVQRKKAFDVMEKVYDYHIDTASKWRKVNRCPLHSVYNDVCDNCKNGPEHMVQRTTMRAPPIEQVRKQEFDLESSSSHDNASLCSIIRGRRSKSTHELSYKIGDGVGLTKRSITLPAQKTVTEKTLFDEMREQSESQAQLIQCTCQELPNSQTLAQKKVHHSTY